MRQERRQIRGCEKFNPPAPACQGPPGWEASSVQSLISYPNVFSIFNQQLINLYQFFHDQSAIDQSAVDKSAVCWSTGQQTGVKYCLLYPLEDHFTTHQVRCLNFGRSWKSVKFQCISNTPENHKNGLPRPPKVTKMRSQEVPKVVKITKIPKKWNLMKTSILTVLWKG